MLTQERANQLLRYDPATGFLYWKRSRGTAKSGKMAGCIHPSGYVHVSVDGKKGGVKKPKPPCLTGKRSKPAISKAGVLDVRCWCGHWLGRKKKTKPCGPTWLQCRVLTNVITESYIFMPSIQIHGHAHIAASSPSGG